MQAAVFRIRKLPVAPVRLVRAFRATPRMTPLRPAAAAGRWRGFVALVHSVSTAGTAFGVGVEPSAAFAAGVVAATVSVLSYDRKIVR